MYENEKKVAAIEALKYVQSNMKLGLGTGSTTEFFLEALGEKVKSGELKNITGVPTSKKTEKLVNSYGIQTFSNLDSIDIDFDGADEYDSSGNLIKGGGGALVREKIVAYNSKMVFIMVDSSKFSEKLHKFPLPVEILPFMEEKTKLNIEKLGCEATFRDNKNFKSDNGNYIIDCKFDYTHTDLEEKIKMIPGVVEVGIFKNITTRIFEGRNGECHIKNIKKSQFHFI